VQSETAETVRSILATHGRFSTEVTMLRDDANLFQAGLTSHASVNLMLALEDAFEVEFPDALLKRATFETITAICSAVDSLLPARAA